VKKLIISTVGTSILTNVIENNNERAELYNNSNCRSKDECPESAIKLIDQLREKALEKLSQNLDSTSLRRLSAELNGIYGLFNGTKINNQDFHYLITTDTYQGKICGEILREFFIKKGINVDIYTPRELTTKTKYNFEQGVKNLLKWCDENLTGYKKSGYEIIFNLTGSFKSLQGYMNTIAMFYADKIIYIFESEKAELIEIPRLPIEIDNKIIEEHKDKIILMSAGYNYTNKDDIINLPKTIIDEFEGTFFLSVWGKLLWDKTKGKILVKDLIELPFLEYTDKFRKLFNEATDTDKVILQETLAKVSKILMENDFDISKLKQDGGLKYENYTNKKDENNNSIGHFRISQSDRISCVAKNRKLYLRKFGRHDFVNDNP